MHIGIYEFKQARSGMIGIDGEVWSCHTIDVCANHARGKKRPWVAVNSTHNAMLRDCVGRVRTFASKEGAARAAIMTWFAS